LIEVTGVLVKQQFEQRDGTTEKINWISGPKFVKFSVFWTGIIMFPLFVIVF